MNRADLQDLAEVRLDEATALLAMVPPRPDGAYYLAGYAIECALKVAIAKRVNQYDWPEKKFVADCHTHDLLNLVDLARLESARKLDMAANPIFDQNWTIVKDWSERDRYERHPEIKARKMIDAITHPVNGVLPWIKARW